MAVKTVADIRNIAFVGHTHAGKTTLGEAILFKSGVTTRMGTIEEGSSVLDIDDESRERKHSVEASAFFIDHNGVRLNFFDTPGAFDHTGVALSILNGVETAVLVVSCHDGIGVNTRRMYAYAKELGLARMVVITRFDADNADPAAALSSLVESFGAELKAINVPASGGKSVINLLSPSGASDAFDVAEANTKLVEAIAETDDALMESYMESGTVPADKLVPTLRRAIVCGKIVPVMFVSSKASVGVPEIIENLTQLAPSPETGKQRTLHIEDGSNSKDVPLVCKPDGDFVAQVLRVSSDPKSGIKYSVARVYSGSLTSEGHLHVSGDKKGARPGHIMKPRADKYDEIPVASAGEIVAFAKLDMRVGQTVFGKAMEGSIALPKFPTPMASLAIEPKSRGDIEKISLAMHRFHDEDPCFRFDRDHDTHELVIQGLGEQHLAVIRSKMKRQFKLEVDTKQPKIPYRETISGSVKYIDYTHKKQTGGAGQYAKVVIDMEPAERGKDLDWEDKIFGGSISQQFRPSVQKGIREQMKKGVIAGYPVVDVKVALVDGKEHPVDSKDIAFTIAGRQVFKKAFVQCRPIMLEPIVNIEVTAPTNFVGDITRDLAGKRGQILSQDILPGGQVLVKASVPLSEVATYSSQLNSVTGGQGSFVMEFSRYDIVPPNIQQQIVAAHKPKDEDDE